MIKRFLSIVLATSLVVLMFCFNISAASTTTITVDPGLDSGGDVWEVVTCLHDEPENIHNDGINGIGWTKNGDVIKLVDPIDFGDGLVSLKVIMSAPDAISETAKLVFKAGTTVIAEIKPTKTGSWAEYVENTVNLKDSVKGIQTVTVEWYNPDIATGFNLGIMNFEVKASVATATVAAASPSPSASATTSSTLVASVTAKAVTTVARPASTTAVKATEPKQSNYTGLIIGIIAGVLVIGATTAFIIIKKKS